MKRITKIFMVAAAGILMFAGCKRGEQVAPLNTIYATMASHNGVNPSGGKSHIDGNSVCWSKGDKIALITTGSEKIEYTLSSGIGTTSGTFEGENPSAKKGPYCVVYPYGSVKSFSYNVDDSGFTVEYSLPQKQNYSKNSFGEGANLSIGYSNDYNFKFLNMMGVLKVTIKNRASCLVNKVELVSKDPNDVLWGNGTVTIKGPTADDLSFGTQLTGGNHILTLEYMKWDAGDVSLYFVVPAGTLQQGFEIKIYEEGYVNPIKDANGEAIEFTNPTTGLNVIQRNMVSELDFGDGRVIQTTGYVDLGAAGNWAPCNWGADKPYESGGYYQFGGKEDVKGVESVVALKDKCPYMDRSAGTNYDYNTATYWKFTKYISKEEMNLSSDDDVVACNSGGKWRIPSSEELTNLYNYCIQTWTSENNIFGCKLENKYSGNYIFLPACGYWGYSNDPKKAAVMLPESVNLGSKSITYTLYAFHAIRIEKNGSYGSTNMYDDLERYYRFFGVPIRPFYVGEQSR